MITTEQVEAMQRIADNNAAWELDEARKDLENGIYGLGGFIIDGEDIKDTQVLIIQPI